MRPKEARSRPSVKVKVTYQGNISHKKTLTLAITLGMSSDTTFIFHMCIPCGKTFLWYQGQGQILRPHLSKTCCCWGIPA